MTIPTRRGAAAFPLQDHGPMLDLRVEWEGDGDEDATLVRPLYRTPPSPPHARATRPDLIGHWVRSFHVTPPFQATLPMNFAPQGPPPNVFLAPFGPHGPPSPFASTTPVAPIAKNEETKKKERRTSRMLLAAFVLTIVGAGLLVWEDPMMRADLGARAASAVALVRR